MGDPTDMIPVVTIEPEGFGNPLVCPCEQEHQWAGTLAQLADLLRETEGDRVIVCYTKMRRGRVDSLGEHEGW